MDKIRFRSVLFGFASLIAALPASSYAQEAAKQQTAVLDDIVVTSERREQKLQDVAATVQAFTNEDFQKIGVNSNFQNLQFLVPGLQINNQEGHVQIYIRGLGNTDTNNTTDPGTAVHLNGAYISRPRGIGPAFYDLERVEVNSGPQGTLRGRNATAGSINIITKAPDFDSINGYVRLGAGNFRTRDAEGAINLPITKNLAVRTAVLHREHSDYIKNILPTGVSGAESENETAARVSILWQPTERLEAYAVYDYANQDGSGAPGNYFGGALATGATFANLNPREQYFVTQGRTQNNINGVTWRLTYDFDLFKAEYNGSYRAFNFRNVNARRPFQQGLFFRPGLGAPGVNFNMNNAPSGFSGPFDPDNFSTLYDFTNSRSTVHELRFFAPDSNRLRWSAGVFYFYENNANFRFDITDKPSRNSNGLFTQDSLGGESRNPKETSESISGYADATYDITDDLRIKGGVRYTSENKASTGYQVQYQFAFPGLTSDQVRFGHPGTILVGPRGRTLNDPLAAGVTPAQFFLAGVQQFGAGDTLGNLIQANPGDVTLTTTANGVQTRRFGDSYVDWRAGIEYDLTKENLLYFTVSTGSRSGGVNPLVRLQGGALAESNFDSEHVTSFELGSKNTFNLGGIRLTANAEAFWYEFDDQVLDVAATGDGAVVTSTNVNANLTVISTNVGKSRIRGINLEAAAAGLPYGLTVGGTFLYLDARYVSALINDGRQSYANSTPPNVDVSGNRLPNSSKVTITGRIGQTLPLSFGSFDWTLAVNYRSQFYLSPFNAQGFDRNGNRIPLINEPRVYDANGDPIFRGQTGLFVNDRVEGVTTINLNAGVNFGSNEQYRFEGYVTNVTNSTFANRAIINAYVNIQFINPPRTVGAKLTAKF